MRHAVQQQKRFFVHVMRAQSNLQLVEGTGMGPATAKQRQAQVNRGRAGYSDEYPEFPAD